ncbi:AAA family ATPase [Hyphomonas sp.]|uniref:AAA family ATPase n=1 Tax=Hyphomonas sp. TaxID=87 RepID=UPI0025BF82A1|nr:AAA family ATPase [Hyphomonas sp.]MBI1399560.1 AAA family ATPase [Hyphomonas sp.]
MPHVYISHSGADPDALLQLHEALRAAGIADRYTTGEPERMGADTEISAAFAVIVLVSAAAVRSRAVRQDVETAKALGVPIIPYQIDKARLNGFFKTEVQPLLRLSSSMEDGLEQLIAETQGAYRRKCPVVAVMNLKGGVGKTTVSAQLSGAWQEVNGGRVLLIDLDPQYNLTQTFYSMEAADASSGVDRSVISLFERSRLHAKDAASPAENWLSLTIAPFTPAPRDSFVHQILGEDGPPGRLDLVSGQFEISKYAFANDRDALAAIKQHFLRTIDHYRSEYDLIVFDTNPNATFLTRCALEAADRVIAPMHADIYSLRGVRLLNLVIRDQVEEAKRPALSVLFNAVNRNEQSTFEGDARNGVYDQIAGFPLSKSLMTAALPRSAHFAVKAPVDGQPPWRQLLVHAGRGGGLKAIRDSLKQVALELKNLSEGGGSGH